MSSPGGYQFLDKPEPRPWTVAHNASPSRVGAGGVDDAADVDARADSWRTAAGSRAAWATLGTPEGMEADMSVAPVLLGIASVVLAGVGYLAFAFWVEWRTDTRFTRPQ
jgi:hypothetical protein